MEKGQYPRIVGRQDGGTDSKPLASTPINCLNIFHVILKQLYHYIDLIHNMGWRYIMFRVWFSVKQKTGLLKRSFPVDPLPQKTISLKDWQQNAAIFFFPSKNAVFVTQTHNEVLKCRAEQILEGKISFFNGEAINLGNNYDWLTNPDTGYSYSATKHWTEINDYSKDAGDVKFVWEKSRFSYLLTLIRYDYHFQKDQAAFVFGEILSWIKANPINLGPNYKCSQEISIRILNWTFALYYYKHSPLLTEEVFEAILHSIHWQLNHVYGNIHFSRIAVRNNHAITESMTLFLAGFLFPYFTESKKWLIKGKKWFEQEIAYQIYPDGTFLQFSMNYHRVIVQLLTWGIRLSKQNGQQLSKVIYERAEATLLFLLACMDEKTGYLPNYGANDGALFFPLNDADFRDYRPQLAALAAALQVPFLEETYEDAEWYGLKNFADKTIIPLGAKTFPNGGYYLLKEREAFTFIRCGSHKDRPSQADNLHLDLWIGGENLLRDSGSYKYNAGAEELKYFFGTASHNTVMLGDHDQMFKGARFIWFYWTQALEAGWREFDDYYEFTGEIQAFKQVAKGIVHKRIVRKFKDQWKWEIIDMVKHTSSLPIRQLWHPAASNIYTVHISATDSKGIELQPQHSKGWYSSKYGVKNESAIIIFSTDEKLIRTFINIDKNL